MDFKANWKILSLIGLISVLDGIKYLINDNNVLLFLASFIVTIVVAIISFFLAYHLANKKLKEERIRIGLKVAFFVITFNTINSYIF